MSVLAVALPKARHVLGPPRKYFQGGTVTGRLTSAQPNQTMPAWVAPVTYRQVREAGGPEFNRSLRLFKQWLKDEGFSQYVYDQHVQVRAMVDGLWRHQLWWYLDLHFSSPHRRSLVQIPFMEEMQYTTTHFIFGMTAPVCGNCDKPWLDHAKGQCLFASTTWVPIP